MTLKNNLKSVYCQARKLFDREVQRSKSLQLYKLQVDILDKFDDNPNDFW